MRRLILAALASVLLYARADEADPTRLVAQLGDPDYNRREAASQALMKLGEEAWPALERIWDSEDTEVRTRAGHLLRAWGWTPPKYRDLLTPVRLSALRSPENDLRQSTVELVLDAGERGREALTWLYDTAPVEVAVEPEPGCRTFEKKDDITLEACLRDKSGHPGWVGGVALSLSFKETLPYGRAVRFSRDDGSTRSSILVGGTFGVG